MLYSSAIYEQVEIAGKLYCWGNPGAQQILLNEKLVLERARGDWGGDELGVMTSAEEYMTNGENKYNAVSEISCGQTDRQTDRSVEILEASGGSVVSPLCCCVVSPLCGFLVSPLCGFLVSPLCFCVASSLCCCVVSPLCCCAQDSVANRIANAMSSVTCQVMTTKHD